MVILSIMRVMLADYPSQYKKSYPSERAAISFKGRLVKKLLRFHRDDIEEGYENCIEESPKFMPTIPDLFDHVKTLDAVRTKNKFNKIEADKLSRLPQPVHNVDVKKILSEAKAEINPKQTEEERLKALSEKLRNHNAVLNIHGRNVTKVNAPYEKMCGYSGCNKAGSVSSGTRGEDNFYCVTHFRMA